MEFWKVAHPDDAPVAIHARSAKAWSYRELRRDISRAEAALPRLGRKSLGLLIAQNRYECLVAYLAALRAGSALMLLDAAINAELLRQVITVYRPDWIFAVRPGAEFCGYHKNASGERWLFEIGMPQEIEIHPDVALLLTT